MKAAAFSCPAVVLHTSKIGDSHLLLELLCAEHGRLTVLARGARASRKRFAGLLQVFSTLQVHVQPGRGLPTLLAADAVRLRLGIRRQLEAIGRASTLCNCVRALVAPGEAAAAMLVHLEEGLDLLDAQLLPAAAGAYPRLLAAAGILPEPSASLSQALRAALGGAPITHESMARELEGWVRVWITRHTGTALPAMTELF